MTAIQPDGIPKVALARDHLRRVNPWSLVAAVRADVETLSPGVFAGMGVVLLGFDNLRARFLATRLLLAARVPFIDVGSLANNWHARVSVCDPRRAAEGLPTACPCCAWSRAQLARSGEDVGIPCAAPESGDGFTSSLVMGQRAASIAAREALALAGAIELAPSSGREVRDDLASHRIEAFLLHESPECPADHALARGRVETLPFEPGVVRLATLARSCGIAPEDEIVLASRELASETLCTKCGAVEVPFRRVDLVRWSCRGCGAQPTPLRRTRRLRWSAAAPEVAERLASSWFERGDRFAVVSSAGARSYAFSAPRLRWQPGVAWNPGRDRARFARLPADWDLDRIRRTRIAVVGVGHVGAAALQQLAPLPWERILLVDRDVLEAHNLPALALGADAPPVLEEAS